MWGGFNCDFGHSDVMRHIIEMQMQTQHALAEHQRLVLEQEARAREAEQRAMEEAARAREAELLAEQQRIAAEHARQAEMARQENERREREARLEMERKIQELERVKREQEERQRLQALELEKQSLDASHQLEVAKIKEKAESAKDVKTFIENVVDKDLPAREYAFEVAVGGCALRGTVPEKDDINAIIQYSDMLDQLENESTLEIEERKD